MSGMISRINNLSVTDRRIALIVGLVVIVGAMSAGLYLALRPGQKTLFRHLPPRDAAVVAAELDKEKVPYTYDESTGAILIASSEVRSARLKLLEGGLHLNGVTGLELFNQSDLGLTDFTQKVNYQRALQGEIARTIMTFDDVTLARVHITMPETSLFRREQARPKASVAVFMHGDASMSKQSVLGIQQLVASSVPDMLPSDVVIVDQRGQLSERVERPQDNALDYVQKALDHYLEGKVAPALAAIHDTRSRVDVRTMVDVDKVDPEVMMRLTRSIGMRVDSAARCPGPLCPVVDENQASAIPLRESLSKDVEKLLQTDGVVQRMTLVISTTEPLHPATQSEIASAIAKLAPLRRERGDTLTFVTSGPSVDQPAAKGGGSNTEYVGGPGLDQDSRRVLEGDRHRRTLGKQARPMMFGVAAAVVGLWIIGMGVVLLMRRRRSTDRLTKDEQATIVRRLEELLLSHGSRSLD